jgi:hypothetical protein
MKRKWSGAPKWVDYTAQILMWVSWKMPDPSDWLRDWAMKLVDRYCVCEACEWRRTRRVGR